MNNDEGGSDIIKLFPATNYTHSFIKFVNGPLPHVRIMPTGGINLDNIQEWLKAGAVAVGIGSDLNKAYAAGGIDTGIRTEKQTIKEHNS